MHVNIYSYHRGLQHIATPQPLRSFEELAETLATLVRGVLGSNREADPTLIRSTGSSISWLKDESA